jgi:hypothetical protein
MAKLLAEIEMMSEDEAERLLAQLSAGAERERGEKAEPGPS